MRARVDEPRPQMFNLIEHLRPRGLERVRHRWVGLLERRAKFVEVFIQDAFGFGEGRGGPSIQTLFDDFRDRRVQTVEKVAQLKAILLHRFLMTSFYDRE